ncbi:FkbM family methyltransferase [Rhizobium sp. BK181]|uniref:FkbM family methyltransferase n=1 Tax=Rhizobium sp. BK181 TaxID=2587072 RepID=UPI00161713AC|nr:FkbM family methyltransferase [Rhizobium sp. BK181]MBB3319409.1 FkbM family methyltransferase [Rhizobium sp. BK181]
MKHFASGSQLVFDLGMNNGDDTDYYLKRGFRVVALEANPTLCESAARRFETEVNDGRLTIVHAAIWEHSGEAVFHINLENDHWSSIDIGWAGRNDGTCRAITVRCVTLSELFAEYGVPLYLKIDVEGVDHVVLDQLKELPSLPLYVSVEDCRFGFQYLETLAACGYDGFKLLDQSTVPSLRDSSLGYNFPVGSSGPFGDDVPGAWSSYGSVVDSYSHTVRDFNGNRLAPRTQWWDIHCTRTPQEKHHD